MATKHPKKKTRPVAKKPARKRAKAAAKRPVRHKPESLRLREVAPSITATDLQRSLAWYRDVLMFTVEREMTRDGRMFGVVLRAGAVTFLLSQDDFAKGRDRTKGEGLRLYCETRQNVDRLAADIKARGGTLYQEPTDQAWGARDFAVVDPDGFKIAFSNTKA